MPTLSIDLPDGGATPLLVGFSGGVDSTVLLHLLADAGLSLRALHVHHGLHADADAWAAHCRSTCESLGIPLIVARVEVTRAGAGLEAAARDARHAAFADHLRDGETLVLAHHRDDQAETVLLRLLRSSGTGGLAAMRTRRVFGRGEVWRPLLDIPRADLLAYAQTKGLSWIEDPSNTDESLDRNFLRARVLPLLAERWPQATSAMARSAALLAEEARLLDGETAKRLALVQGVDPAVLAVDGLLALDPAWRHRVLRAWIAALGLPPLPGAAFACIDDEMLPVRSDAEPEYRWAGCVLRRWRNLLHAEVARPALPADWQAEWSGAEPLALPSGDRLAFAHVGAGMTATTRSDGELVAARSAPTRARPAPTMVVRGRRGGERITLPGRQHSHALKKVLQDLGVPIWERERLPLLFADDGELLAVGDLAMSARLAAWCEGTGKRLAWEKCDGSHEKSLD